jgi:hypothetical protein
MPAEKVEEKKFGKLRVEHNATSAGDYVQFVLGFYEQEQAAILSRKQVDELIQYLESFKNKLI